ncbi:hypothetical protein ACKWTF_003766 [Chironomus riparius]
MYVYSLPTSKMLNVSHKLLGLNKLHTYFYDNVLQLKYVQFELESHRIMSDSINVCSSSFKIFDGKDWTYLNISHVSFELFIALIAIIGNLLVLLVFLREQRLRRDINYYILSLALGDLGVGLVSIPIYMITSDHPYTKHLCYLPLCLAKMSILVTFANISVFSLVLISIKRLKVLSIRVPKSQQEPKIIILIEIGMCWIIAISIGTVPLYFYNEESKTCYIQDILRWEYLIFRLIIVVVIPMIIIGFVYFKIYKLINEQAQKKIVRNNSNLLRKQVDQKSIDKEVRATISISIIVLVFCITWIPLQIIYLLSIFCKDCIKVYVVNFAISFLHLSSAINPLIYAYRMKDIRKAIYNLFFISSLPINSSFNEDDLL